MSSVSKFTIKDYNLIRKEWEKLFISAAQRCRDEEELSMVESSVEERDDGKIVYTWHAKNSAQAFEEPDMPPFYLLVQHTPLSK